jgi:hypothetical protein
MVFRTALITASRRMALAATANVRIPNTCHIPSIKLIYRKGSYLGRCSVPKLLDTHIHMTDISAILYIDTKILS